ncbi:MAG: hypothetical protein WDN47_03310 [Candidatus Doudnabacteria bacterium]
MKKFIFSRIFASCLILLIISGWTPAQAQTTSSAGLILSPLSPASASIIAGTSTEILKFNARATGGNVSINQIGFGLDALNTSFCNYATLITLYDADTASRLGQTVSMDENCSAVFTLSPPRVIANGANKNFVVWVFFGSNAPIGSQFQFLLDQLSASDDTGNQVQTQGFNSIISPTMTISSADSSFSSSSGVSPNSGSISITTSSPLPNAVVGQPYSANVSFAQSGNSGIVVRYVGLPPGIGMPIVDGPSPVTSVTTIIGANATNDISLAGTSTVAGTYNITLSLDNNMGLVKTKQFSLTVNANGASLFPHPDNTNVLGPDGTVYRIQSGHRSPYTSAGAFLSYGFNQWETVIIATADDMSLPLTTYTPTGANTTTTYFIPPRNGSLINDHGTIYLITNGLRTGFTNAPAFLELGYSFANAADGDTSFMVTLPPISNSSIAHPDGTLINDHGTIYMAKDSSRVGIPSMDVFNSWGLKLKEVVPANSLDLSLPSGGTITTRMDNQLSI